MSDVEPLVRLYRGGPFHPPDLCADAMGLRATLRATEGGDAGLAPGWEGARRGLADLLEERGDDERWLARLPWLHARSARLGREGRRLHVWSVAVPAAMPPVFLSAASELEGSCNAGPLMGWLPGELKLLRVEPRRLVFTSLKSRGYSPDADLLMMPGGLKGLAWLYWRLLEGTADACAG